MVGPQTGSERPPALAMLVERMDRDGAFSATLGEIAEAWKSDRREANWDGNSLKRLYREAFGERPDYALYLLMQQNPLLSWCDIAQLEARLAKCEPVVQDALPDKQDPIVIWGALSVLGHYFGRKVTLKLARVREWHRRGELKPWQRTQVETHLRTCPDCGRDVNRALVHCWRQYSAWADRYPERLLAFAPRCKELIGPGGVNSIPGCEVACSIVGALILAGIEKIRFDSDPRGRIDLDYVREILDGLACALKALQCEPGDFVDLTAFREERKCRLLIPNDPYEVQVALTQACYRARGMVRGALTGKAWSPDFDRLTKEAARWALSASQGSRSIRRSEEKASDRAKAEGRPYRMSLSWRTLQSNEYQNLRRASQAARDAGDYLQAARLAAHWAFFIPDELLDDSRYSGTFGQVPDDIAFSIRQLGLVFPQRQGRFGRKGGSAACKPVSGARRDDEPITWVACADPDQSAAEEPEDEAEDTIADLFWQGIAWEQTDKDSKLAADWATIAQYSRSQPGKPLWDSLERLIDDAPRLQAQEQASLVPAAYRLCLYYYRLRDAAELLARFPDSRRPTKIEILDFAHHVKRAFQALPYLADIRVFKVWQKRLRSALRGFDNGEWDKLPADDALVLHEMLLVRCLSMIRSRNGVRAFAQRFFGRPDEADLRDMLITERGLAGRGIATVDKDNLVACVKRLSQSMMGTPAVLSVVSVSPDQLSFLPIDENGPGTPKLVPVAGIMKAASEVGQRLRKGPPTPWPDIPWSEISWMEPCYKLAGQLCDVLAHSDRGRRWLILAIEPALATIPWQSMLAEWMRKIGSQFLVSLIPSLSWLCWVLVSRQRGTDAPPTPPEPTRLLSTLEQLVQPYARLSTSQLARIQEEFRSLREQMGLDLQKLIDAQLPWAVVVGHGCWDEENRFATVLVEEGPLKLQRLLDIGGYPVVLVDACYGGHVQDQLLGDLAGVPGLLLAMRSRLVCAAISAVPPEAVKVLHRHLLANTGRSSFGERYLAAINEEPTVGLYNLFGFPDEPVASSPKV